MSDRLRIIPLGGLGEIGKNMMIVEYGDDIFVIDAGLMFPTEEMPGVDIVIPDISYLVENIQKVKAIVLTHGHEDHIGALPYIIERLPVPIYGTELTLGLVKAKLREFYINNLDFRTITAGDIIELGVFKIEFFRVIHSISGGVGMAIHTPEGVVVHSGDFKFDQTPIDGKTADISFLARLGEEGVLLLLSDSTYAERPGFSMSERIVGQTLDQMFSRCPGRIIITTFASSIPRIQQILDVSEKCKKKVCSIGKSLVGTISIASELGYLRIPGDTLIRVEELNKIPYEEQVILTTGSQGEPMSALTLMATRNHKWIKIKKGDTVIISATPVPGNETLVANTINLLFRLGADVIYSINPKSEGIADQAPKIHVSGHASREELKLLMGLVRPKFFVPIHGEYRHLVHHARLAAEMGIPEKNIFKLEDGEVLEINDNTAKVAGRVSAGDVLVDGLGVGDVGKVVLRDRNLLSQDGIVMVVLSIERNSGEILAGPEVISRGFVYVKESEELLEEARKKARDVLERVQKEGIPDTLSLKDSLKAGIVKFLYERTGRRPMIVPVIMEV